MTDPVNNRAFFFENASFNVDIDIAGRYVIHPRVNSLSHDCADNLSHAMQVVVADVNNVRKGATVDAPIRGATVIMDFGSIRALNENCADLFVQFNDALIGHKGERNKFLKVQSGDTAGLTQANRLQFAKVDAAVRSKIPTGKNSRISAGAFIPQLPLMVENDGAVAFERDDNQFVLQFKPTHPAVEGGPLTHAQLIGVTSRKTSDEDVEIPRKNVEEIMRQLVSRVASRQAEGAGWADQEKPATVAIDFSNVTAISNPMLQPFMDLHNALRNKPEGQDAPQNPLRPPAENRGGLTDGNRLVLVGTDPQLSEVFNATNLRTFFGGSNFAPDIPTAFRTRPGMSMQQVA